MKTTEEILKIATTLGDTRLLETLGMSSRNDVAVQYESLKSAIDEMLAEIDELRDELCIEKINTECYLVGSKKMHDDLREKLKQQKYTPFAWAVSGVSRMFIGEYAEADAHAEAKRCGGTCEAFALYRVYLV